jgi:ATP adenylyltransferase
MSAALNKEALACCPYCTDLFGSPQSTRAPWNEILWSRDEVFVVPTRGALVEGWLLAIPRQHVLSSLALSKDRRNVLLEVAADAATRVGRIYGRTTIFEHGAGVERSVVGCGIDHAHLHIVPLGFDLAAVAREHVLGQQLTWRAHTSWSNLNVAVGSPYVAVDDRDKVWCGLGPIPSQFFRRVIAEKLGCHDQFDWKQSSGLDHVARTVARLRSTEPAEAIAAS